MSSKLFRTCVALIALSASNPGSVCAEIYSWRDAAGHLVLSDTPKPGAVTQTFAVDRTTAFRTTRPAASRRSQAFHQLIEDHSAAQGVNSNLVRAVIQAESAFNPNARSVKGAMGLMQLMPGTAAEYGVTDPYNPSENIRAGVAYLKHLLVKFAPRLELALAAYNAGPAAVQKYGTIPPYKETRNYVAKITTATGHLPSTSPSRMYRTVEIVNGREVARYSNTPSAGAEIVKTR
jgi:soluble lytic murein transglycosylase-like protein